MLITSKHLVDAILGQDPKLERVLVFRITSLDGEDLMYNEVEFENMFLCKKDAYSTIEGDKNILRIELKNDD